MSLRAERDEFVLVLAHNRRIAEPLRFVLRASPRGGSGLTRVDGALPIDAHWALHGMPSPRPEDGPAPLPPKATYDSASLAQAGREGFPHGADGFNSIGEEIVPLETVRHMAIRRRLDAIAEAARRGICDPENYAFYRGWRELVVALDAAIADMRSA